jgi:Flp pilus assembly protein TadD
MVSSWFFYGRKARTLTDKDTIVLADFANTTGDTVFDGTLRQGLAVQLEQSPFLTLVSDGRLQQALPLMGQPSDAKLTPAIALELCRRTGSAAVLEGSIAQIGTQYNLILKALNCSNGDTLTSTEAQASDKNRVLDALGIAVSEIRNKLGESLATVQKFDTPLEQATTTSLEALQAYSLGLKAMTGRDGSAAAIPLLQRAIKLDPNFAMAYTALGVSYSNLAELSLAAVNVQKAFELRDRVSEREKLTIESSYYQNVSGNLEKALQALDVLAQTYPRDVGARNALGGIAAELGQLDKALSALRDAIRLNPRSRQVNANLVRAYRGLNRFDEARAAAEEAKAKNLDSSYLRFELYPLAFLQNDASRMQEQVVWSTGKPGVENMLLAFEADTAGYSGHLGKAREYSHRAVASSERSEERETAAILEADAAVREARFGNLHEARHWAKSALGRSRGRDVQYFAALALAMAREGGRAELLADDLGKRFPADTLVQFSYLPTLRAQFALNHSEPSKAIGVLQAAAPYELGHLDNGALYPVFARGEAYLAAHQGSEAGAEFQKILDHRGIVANDSIGALVHVGLARSYVLQGDTAKARAAYQDFLSLWKDADPDIPILQQAKAEYAKLK